MTMNEVEAVLEMLGGLYPGRITEQVADLLCEDLKRVHYQHAIAVAKEHRRNHDYFRYSEFRKSCLSTGPGAAKRMGAVPTLSFTNTYRRQRPDLADAGEYEVIVRIHRSWCAKADSEGGRVMVSRGCESSLCAAGMDALSAKRWAEYPFLANEDCQHWLDQLRQIDSRPNQEVAAA